MAGTYFYSTMMPTSDFNLSAMYSEMINRTNNETDILQPPYWTLTEQILLSAVLIPIIVVSMVGNALVVISVIYFKDMQRKTYVLIANLAIADLGVSLLCMPVSLGTVIKGDWVFGDTFCNINGFFEALFLFASIHGLMHISIHKYFQLARPLQRVDKKWASVMIALTWIVAFTVAMAPVVGLTENEYKPGTSQCGPKFPEGVTGVIHAGYSVLMGFIIPWTVLVICYTIIFRNITKHGKRMERNSSMGQRRVFMQQKRITVTLFVVFIVFFICWSPFIIFNIFGFTLGFENIPIWPNAYVYWMGYLNSAINPVIYGWRNRTFKKAFRAILHCCNTSSTFKTEDGVVRTNTQRTRRTTPILSPPVTPSTPSRIPSSRNRFTFDRQVSHVSVGGSAKRRIKAADKNGGLRTSGGPARAVNGLIYSISDTIGPRLNNVVEEDDTTTTSVAISNSSVKETDVYVGAHMNPAFDGIVDESSNPDTTNGDKRDNPKTTDEQPDVCNVNGINGIHIESVVSTEINTTDKDHTLNTDDESKAASTKVSSEVENARENHASKLPHNGHNGHNKQIQELRAETNPPRKSSLTYMTKIGENLISALSTVTAPAADDVDNEILLSADELDEGDEYEGCDL